MLCSYAKQIAWLHGTPKGRERKESRLEELEKSGQPIELPDITTVRYLVDWLNDLGWIQMGAMGPIGLTATEIRNWADMSDLELTPFEFAAIRAASRAYVSQYHNESNTPPFKRESTKPNLIGKFKSIAAKVNK